MKTHLFELAVRSAQAKAMSRRRLLQGAAGTAALAALGLPKRAAAQDSVRAQILAIPGVGMGQPTDVHWQQVGAL